MSKRMQAPTSPTLETTRLILRPYAPSDAEALARVCNNMNVVRWTSSHPFPYEVSHATEYLARIEREFAEGKSVSFAAVLRESGELIGGVGLKCERAQERAEVGYMLSEEHWGKGYATEATARVLRFAFEELKLSRVNASVHATNTGSIRVLEKLGLIQEGVQRRHVYRFGEWNDLVLFGILREEWLARA